MRTGRDGRGQDKAGGDASEEEGTREHRADGGCQEQLDKTDEETGEKRAKTQEREREGQALYRRRTVLNKRQGRI